MQGGPVRVAAHDKAAIHPRRRRRRAAASSRWQKHRNKAAKQPKRMEPGGRRRRKHQRLGKCRICSLRIRHAKCPGQRHARGTINDIERFHRAVADDRSYGAIHAAQNTLRLAKA